MIQVYPPKLKGCLRTDDEIHQRKDSEKVIKITNSLFA